MDQIKRKRNSSKFTNGDTKKLRPTIDNENNSNTSIEDLSNEVFYEIFDYLDGYDICKAFSNLNIRFQQLLSSSSLLLKISLSEKASSETRNDCKGIIVLHKKNILSLRLWNSIFIYEIFTDYVTNTPFNHLESLSLFGISAINLMTIFDYLKSLPRCFSLRIDLETGYSDYFNEIYQMTLRLPFLKYNRLSVLTEEKLNILIPVATNEQFSTIEYFVMSHICDLNELVSILHHTPRLRRLTCQSLVESNHSIKNEAFIALPNLTEISIHDCHMKFNKFEDFIKKICSQLQVLKIKEFWDMNFIYPERWEQLILQNMPYLFRFTLKCHMFSTNYFRDIHHHTLINQFTSRFWFERGWVFQLNINPKKIFYLIYPNRKVKFTSNRNTKNTVSSIENSNQDSGNPSEQFSSPIELSITNYSAMTWSPSFIDILRPVLLSVHFTSLNLFWSGMTCCTLIKLLSLLPTLESMKISSSLLLKMHRSYIEDAKRLCINNRITKVWQWMDFGLVQFLIKLCGRMEHFEVAGVKDVDLEKLVRFILMNVTIHNLHLRTLRLNVYNAKDTMIDKLKYMIDFEKLLADYIIKRSDNVISLQWKLK